MPKMDAAALQAALAHFYGTDGYTRATGIMRSLVMSDGVKFLCENAECYWLMDVIASHIMTNKRVRDEGFQTWKLVVNDSKGRVTMTRGEGQAIVTQDIEFSDFPLPEITLFVADGIGGPNDERVRVVMLPSEN